MKPKSVPTVRTPGAKNAASWAASHSAPVAGAVAPVPPVAVPPVASIVGLSDAQAANSKEPTIRKANNLCIYKTPCRREVGEPSTRLFYGAAVTGGFTGAAPTRRTGTGGTARRAPPPPRPGASPAALPREEPRDGQQPGEPPRRDDPDIHPREIEERRPVERAQE